jgi:TRAP-type mannitol/chloroaromatic compound transport system permease small subunit|tara:strand:+ start:1062 stop:1664 length:603 start_codon:yes stop_codon:yes gene_type:complete
LPIVERQPIIPAMSILSRVAKAIDGINERIGAIIRWLALVMVLVGAATAILRYSSRGLGLSLNLTPTTELQWYLFSLIFLLGAAYGLRHDVHVRVDVLYSQLNPKKRAWIDLVGHVLFLIPFCIVMLYVSWPAVQNSWSIREISPDPGGLPRYPIKMVILLSFVLLVGQGYSQILKQLRILRSDGDQEPSGVESQHGAGP